ncbi:MAG: vWA domain-containing protein [Gammaproteobacteria bacterium]
MFALLSTHVYAKGEDLRIAQVLTDLPTLVVWANLPGGQLFERSQFNVSVDEHEAKIFDIDRFNQTEEGVGYIFLVDVSKSIRSRQLVQIKRSLHYWLDGMGKNDVAALITFGHEFKHELEFTKDYFKLSNAISMLAINDMETSLSHGLLEALDLGYRQKQGLPARRAIIVFGTGINDSGDEIGMKGVFKKIRGYGVPIYTIGFASEPVNEIKQEGLGLLESLATESGGYFVQTDSFHLQSAYDEQRQRITQAYRLRVDCPDCLADKKSHRLSVSWSDGWRKLSDDMEIKFLPKPAHHESHSTGNEENQKGWSGFIFATGLLAFLLGLVWVYKDRLA